MDGRTDVNPPDPAPGRQVILLSMTDGEAHHGTVRTWTGSSDGLVMSARVSVSVAGTQVLANDKVWLTVPEHGQGLTVYSGVARRVEEGALDVTGIRTVLREQRRQHLRAPADGVARIPSTDEPARQLRLLDLSQGGVRVALREPAELVLGERVVLDVRLEDGSEVTARGEVARVDPGSSHAVVRFEDLSPEQGSRIDRYVLLRLTGRES